MINWITLNIGEVIQLITQVVGVFAIIAAWTPNAADNKVAAMLLEGVNFLGANLNKARNAPDA
mgnify:CR=1 FL=1|jgi:hypothetical protein|tara:strand:- start:24 stop:212 length:189 start_codon:yes stop_codon:yes gene_type:complete